MRMLSTVAALAALLLTVPAFAQDEEAESGGGSADTGEMAAEDAESQADEEEENSSTGKTLAERISAVSRPVFLKEGRFELTPFLGASTSDAFFRRWNGGARASYHLLDSFSIDVGGAGVFWSQPLEAAVFLGGNDPDIADEAVLFGIADAGVTFAPFYGKVALLSEWIIHFDTFISGGAGAVFDSANPVAPTLEVGAGGRIVLTRWLTLRVDVRDYIYPTQRTGANLIQNLIMLNVGLGIYIPFDFEAPDATARSSG